MGSPYVSESITAYILCAFSYAFFVPFVVSHLFCLAFHRVLYVKATPCTSSGLTPLRYPLLLLRFMSHAFSRPVHHTFLVHFLIRFLCIRRGTLRSPCVLLCVTLYKALCASQGALLYSPSPYLLAYGFLFSL